MERYWVVTASADHAANGKEWGIVQACHGKVAPLRRMQTGDGIVIYSPRSLMRGGDPVMGFTAIGRIGDDQPYEYDMGAGFIPWRRGVNWQASAQVLPIHGILDQLDLTRGQPQWGMMFRYGHREISRADFALIARRMMGL